MSSAQSSRFAALHTQSPKFASSLAILALHGVCRLLQLPGPHYVFLTSDPDPTTGVPWCPYCALYPPAVKKVMADKEANLLEVMVGQRPV
jgi:hypothetical protein